MKIIDTANDLTLSNLMRAELLGMIFGSSTAKTTDSFPEHIEQFTFQKVLTGTRFHSYLYDLGLYRDKQEKKVFAKKWKRKSYRDLSYYTLRNEIVMSKLLTDVLKRERKFLPGVFRELSFPDYRGSLIDTVNLVLLTEYIDDSKTAYSLDKKQVFDLYMKSADFLKYLGCKMKKEEQAMVGRRTIAAICMLYPLFLLKTLVFRPTLWKPLLQGIHVVIGSLPQLLKRKQISLVHRDLNLNNLLIGKGEKVFLHDMQFCLFSDEVYDLLFPLRIHFDDKYLRPLLLQEIYKRSSTNKQSTGEVHALMVIAATHAVTGSNLPLSLQEKNEDFLRFTIGETNKS